MIEALPKKVAKMIHVVATETSLTLRRPPKTQWLNLISGCFGMWLAVRWIMVGTVLHRTGFTVAGAIFALFDLVLLSTTLSVWRASVVLDRVSDQILDKGKVVGALSALDRFEVSEKSGVVKIVARFTDGSEAALAPLLLGFTRRDDAESVVRLLQGFAGRRRDSAEPQQPWALTSQ